VRPIVLILSLIAAVLVSVGLSTVTVYFLWIKGQPGPASVAAPPQNTQALGARNEPMPSRAISSVAVLPIVPPPIWENWLAKYVAELNANLPALVQKHTSTRVIMLDPAPAPKANRTSLDVGRELKADSVLVIQLDAYDDKLGIDVNLIAVETGLSVWTKHHQIDHRKEGWLEQWNKLPGQVVNGIRPHVTAADAKDQKLEKRTIAADAPLK
jgi:hypothetical protein